ARTTGVVLRGGNRSLARGCSVVLEARGGLPVESRAMALLFSPQYRLVFGQPWPVWAAALLVAMVNVSLFAFDRPWTASDGMRNWGDWVLTGLGVVRRADLLAPWLYSGSLLNPGVLLRGLVAALLSREFAVRLPPRGEPAEGAGGGPPQGV